VKARGRDARPVLTFFSPDVPLWVRGIFDLDGLAGTMKLEIGTDLLAVQNVIAKGGDFEVRGSYLKKSRPQAEHFS
jgi:hypothetical protein